MKKKEINNKNKNRNIWFFNHYAKTPDMSGGSRHYAISRILVSRGYRVTLFASGFNHNKNKDLKCGKHEPFKIEMIDGIRYVWIKTYDRKRSSSGDR